MCYCVGNTKSACLGLLDSLLETLGQPPTKRRDVDIMNYTYTTVGFPNRRNTNGGLGLALLFTVDYLGVVHCHVVTNEASMECLCHAIQQISLENVTHHVFQLGVDSVPHNRRFPGDSVHHQSNP